MKHSAKKYSRKKQQRIPHCYLSIDTLPVLNWHKIHESGDLSHLLIRRKNINKAEAKHLKNVWTSIYDEYIKHFGWGENFKRIIEKRRQIAKLTLKMLVSRDYSMQTFIDVENYQLEQLIKSNNKIGGDIYSAKSAIEKSIGIRIPLGDTSVREFYSYIRDMQKRKNDGKG